MSHHTLLAMPRAVQRVFANQDPAKVLAELKTAVEGFKAKHEGRMDNVQSAIDDIYAKIGAGLLNGGALGDVAPPDPEYTKTYATWFRRGGDALGPIDIQGSILR